MTAASSLAVDPALWEAFAEDRKLYPWGSSPRCQSCGWVIRPRGTSEADYPGTKPKGANGKCRACHKRTKPRVRTPMVKPGTLCADETCRVPMRPGKHKPADFPGTRRHSGYGYCSTCYTRRSKTQDWK